MTGACDFKISQASSKLPVFFSAQKMYSCNNQVRDNSNKGSQEICSNYLSCCRPMDGRTGSARDATMV